MEMSSANYIGNDTTDGATGVHHVATDIDA